MNIEALHQVLDSEICYFLEWGERPLKNHSIFSLEVNTQMN